jgi:pyridoxal/pyridoxine/pyridoxamine kinase
LRTVSPQTISVVSSHVACGLAGPYFSIFVMLFLLADCKAVIPLQLSRFQGFSGQ